MGNESIEQFFKLLADNPKHQAYCKNIGGDADKLAAYARTLGFEIDTKALQDYQNTARDILNKRLEQKKANADISVSPGARAFYGLINLADTDAEVARRLEELASDTPEELIAYGEEKGFVFNRQDMQAIGKDILEPANELSEEELELAAGGALSFMLLMGLVAGLSVAAGAVAGGAAVGGAVVGVTMLVAS